MNPQKHAVASPADIELTPKGLQYAIAYREDPLVFGARKLPTLQRLRAEAAAWIEELLALVDAIDADPDLEDTADGEPSIPSIYGDDREEDPSEQEDDGSDYGEPSLGWSTNIRQSGRSWLGTKHDDREDDRCDLEPSLGFYIPGTIEDGELDPSDEEPWLGRTEAINQTRDPISPTKWGAEDGEQAFASTPREDASRMASRSDDEREGDAADTEDAAKPDDEWSLGWPESVCQGLGLLGGDDSEADGPAYS